jgi:hypothetical protein
MPSGYKGKRQYSCLACGKNNDWCRGGKNKYCNNICQWKYRYETITLPAILEGKISSKANKPIVSKFLEKRDGYKCSICNISEWLGEKLILDIDHIDGNNNNELPSNWRFLCPNCHRMTPTWGNKKRI